MTGPAHGPHTHEHHTHEHHTHEHHAHDGHDHPGPGSTGWAAGERPPDGGPVVLDIGGGYGALLVHLPDDRFGTELHVRRPGSAGPTVHTGVWRRWIGPTESVVAVFPELPAGPWALLADDGAERTLVTVPDGSVVELRMP